jgi:23S rRNA pseudouridine2605 synthase
MSERLQKFLARIGQGSRRQIEDWIRQGRITINGVPAQLGVQVNGAERIEINGQRVQVRAFGQKRRVLAYYKPVGEVTSRSDPEGRPTIFEKLPILRDSRWIAVGRLDLNTQGLLLLTNDGELANRLMHPSSQIEREYAVRILGDIPPATLQQLREGVQLEDGVARFDDIREAGGEGANHWYHVILREGRHREVRRLWESQGVAVSRLVRVRYGSVSLRRGLHPGHWDELNEAQIDELRKAVGITPEPQLEPAPRPDSRTKKPVWPNSPRRATPTRAHRPSDHQ